ncbi:MAG: exodeoxyribonuclease VII small subunit [Clostridia bacterium]|nr:exodeoxyribonuclease VII small subunit [Clostridia bacterium]
MNNDIKFEELIEKLEDEVKKLESGNISLDEALLSFENAIGLVKQCNERLETAERRVRLLVESANGEVSDREFDINSDET